MKEYRQHLAKTEIVAVSALLLVALTSATIWAVQTSNSPNDSFSPLGAAIAMFSYTLMIGCLPVVAFGAPLYALLLKNGKATWYAALTIGVAPGLLLLLVAQDIGLWSIGCGAAVALITHIFCRQGSNYALKGTSV